ncbi:MAG: hypothetical protein H7296_14005 [Bacteroidia bacterium]|nr:hypothetical protein [Bacteroidia bacterium]
MSVYEQTNIGATAQIETDLYGSSRLGLQTERSEADISKWNETATLSILLAIRLMLIRKKGLDINLFNPHFFW